MIIAIQVRCDSKRFPRKIFSKVNNKSIIENIIDNLSVLNLKICLCSTNRKIDKDIKKISLKKKCFFYGGSKNNVLNRLYNCAKKFNSKNLIRINGDSPLISSHLILKAIKYRKKFPQYDIITNVFPRTFPRGMSVEIIKTDCLKKLNLMKLTKTNKEHVTKFIYKNPELFKIKNFNLKKDFSNINLSVDTKNDLKFVKSKQNLFKKVENYKILKSKYFLL